jgi:hypothetical protein
MSLKSVIRTREKKFHEKRFFQKTLATSLVIILLIGTILPTIRSDTLDPWWNLDWQYRKEIIIDHTKVEANLVHFPVLIAVPSDSDLALGAQSDGDDIVFTDNSGVKLNHEIELFSSSTGRLIAWVKVPSLSSSADTHLYMYYGNSASGSQQNPQGTWDAEYLMVHHMEETGNIFDSTSNGLNAVNYGTSPDSNGMIDGCRYYDSLTDRYDFGNPSVLNPGLSSWTITLWTKMTHVEPYSQMLRKWGSSAGFILWMYTGWGGYNYFKVSDGVSTCYRYWDTSFSDGNWHYLTIVINRDTNQLDLYLDGVPHNGVASGSLVGMGSIATTASGLLYGGNNGRYDDFTISTVIRSAGWIKTSYNNQHNPSGFFSLGAEEQASPSNHRPTLSDEVPQNGVTVGVNQSSVSVMIQDFEGDVFDWFIHGPYVVDASGSGAGNGTKTASLIVPLPPNTEIVWFVNVSDPGGSGQWTNETFRFFTSAAPSSWWDLDWQYRKEIIIDHTKVEANLVHFPVLIAVPSDSDLALGAQSDGDDIVFTDSSGVKLNHEIELFTSSTGRLIAWVNVPSLSSSADTHLYMYYGNSASGSQQNPQGTWDAEYLMVHHMEETGNIFDSTSNGLNAVNYGTSPDSNGMIDGCRYYDSLTDRYDFGNPSVLNPGLSSWTITLWTKMTHVEPYSQMLRKWGSSAGFILWMYTGWGGYNYFKVSDGVSTCYRYWDTSFSDGNWHYLTIVINRDTNQLDLYLDGVPHNGVASGSLVGMGSIATTASGLLYGGNNGRYDDFTISTVIRSAGWIKTSYNNQHNPSGFFSLGAEEQASPSNHRPTLSDEVPQNGVTVGVNQSSVSVMIQDFEGDVFDWFIHGPYVVDASGSGAGNGTKTASLIVPLPPNTEIVWFVNVSDPGGSGQWTNATYRFRTVASVLPTLKYVISPGLGISAVAPLAADVNNDGKMEIIRTSEYGISVYDGATGNVLWTKQVTMWNDHCPA